MERLRKCVNFKSIRFRLTVTVSLLMLGAFFCCWLANQIFLPSFYQHEKCQRLISLYTQVSDGVNELNSGEDTAGSTGNVGAWEDVTLDEQVELAIEKLSEDSNISIYILLIGKGFILLMVQNTEVDLYIQNKKEIAVQLMNSE